MTVSEFACSMYRCDIVKDIVRVICDDEVLYNGRVEFLRYANEEGMSERLWYADEIIEEVEIKATPHNIEEVPNYTITIKVRSRGEYRWTEMKKCKYLNQR